MDFSKFTEQFLNFKHIEGIILYLKLSNADKKTKTKEKSKFKHPLAFTATGHFSDTNNISELD